MKVNFSNVIAKKHVSHWPCNVSSKHLIDENSTFSQQVCPHLFEFTHFLTHWWQCSLIRICQRCHNRNEFSLNFLHSHWWMNEKHHIFLNFIEHIQHLPTFNTQKPFFFHNNKNSKLSLVSSRPMKKHCFYYLILHRLIWKKKIFSSSSHHLKLTFTLLCANITIRRDVFNETKLIALIFLHQMRILLQNHMESHSSSPLISRYFPL